jgi:hypothetical protein
VAELKRVESLSDFNKLFNVWLAECYHNKIHDGINMPPEEAYKSSRTPLKFADAAALANAFLRVEKREVDKSGCVSFGGKKYEVGEAFIGRKIDLL